MAVLIATLLSTPCSLAGVPGPESGYRRLEEVVVTAQKREQDNQSVSVSVTSFTGDYLERSGVQDIVDIAPMTPGLVISTYDAVNPQLFVRGIGTAASDAGQDSSVSVFVDEVYTGRAGSVNGDYLDLQRVEVLRGPQGTLYGRNSAGGAINLITAKPTASPQGYAKLAYGRFDLIDMTAAVSGSLSDSRVTGRLAVSRRQRDGYVKNMSTGTDNLREYDNSNARAHLLLQLSESMEILLSADYFDSDQLGVSSRKALAHHSPLVAADLIPLDDPVADTDITTLALDAPAHRTFGGLSARFDVNTQSGTLSAISAWRGNRYNVLEDVSGVGLIVLGQDEEGEQFTQELRLAVYTASDLVLTLGLFYLQEDVERVDLSDLAAISDFVNASLSLNLPDAVAYYDQTADNRSYAAFAQAEIPLTSRLTLILGVRYTVDEKAMELTATGADPLGFGLLDAGPFAGAADDRFDQLSGTLGFNHALTDQVMAYIRYAQGYKAGGFNGNAASFESFVTPVAEESVDTIELGIKSSWFDSRMRANLATFFTKYDDLQVFQVKSNGAQFVSNAARAETSGFEAELAARPMEDVAVLLSYAYLDARYTDFMSVVDDDSDGMPDDLGGNILTRSPRHSYSIAVDYRRLLSAGKALEVLLEYTYQDEIFTTPQNRSLDTIDGYAVLDMNLLMNVGNGLALSVFGKNLTNEEYKLHTFDVDPISRGNIESALYADPRTWGVGLHYRF